MGDGRDFVLHLLELVRKAQPEFTEEQAEQVEQQIRKDWGGERPLIAKHASRIRSRLQEKKERVRAQVGTKPDSEIIDREGISRATLYRWIK